MSAIPLLPGVWLVGSGTAGFGLTDPLDCHVYLVEGERGWALIDAGAGVDTAAIVANVDSSGAALDGPGYLLVTHAHADHAGGAEDLVAAFPGLTVVAGADAARWLAEGDELGASVDRGRAQGIYPGGYRLTPCPGARAVESGWRLDLGGYVIEAIATPGHAAGHLCYLLERGGTRVLFSGDCVFTRGRISVQNLHDTDVPAYAHSIAALDARLIDALLPGHHSPALTGGAAHVAAAARAFDAGILPPLVP